MKKKYGILILSLFAVLFMSGCDSESVSPTVSTEIGLATIATNSQKDALISRQGENLVLPDAMEYEKIYSLIDDTYTKDNILHDIHEFDGTAESKTDLLSKEYILLDYDDDKLSGYMVKILDISVDIPFKTITEFITITDHDEGESSISALKGDYSFNLIVSVLKDNKSVYDLSIDLGFNISHLDSLDADGKEINTFKLKKLDIALIFDKSNIARNTEMLLSINETNNDNIVDVTDSIGILDSGSIVQIFWKLSQILKTRWGQEEPFELSLVAHNSVNQLIYYSFNYSQLSAYTYNELSDLFFSMFSVEEMEIQEEEDN